MPLLDHFRPPLSQERHWESFHVAWSSALADALNEELPPGYFAEELTHAGAGVEIDVATFESQSTAVAAEAGARGTATLPTKVWSPPAPTLTIPTVFADDFEVRVFASRTGPRLVAASQARSVASNTAARRFEAVSSGPKRRNCLGFSLITSRKNPPSTRVASLKDVPGLATSTA